MNNHLHESEPCSRGSRRLKGGTKSSYQKFSKSSENHGHSWYSVTLHSKGLALLNKVSEWQKND